MTSRPKIDKEDIARAVAGDRAVLETLLRHVEPGLRSHVSIQPLWQRSIDVEDIMQVSCLEAFLRISTLREPTPAAFTAWMRRIVDNNLRDAIKGLERDRRPDARRRNTRGPKGESARTLFATIADGSATAGGVAATAEEVERLTGAIKSLPRSYRRVIEELDIAERDVDDVADDMGRSRGAIHLLRKRAHDRLREILKFDAN